MTKRFLHKRHGQQFDHLHQSAIVGTLAEMSDPLNRLSFAVERLQAQSDYSCDNAADRIWLVRRWDEIFSALAQLAAYSRLVRWQLSSRRNLEDVPDTHSQHFVNRSWEISAWRVSVGEDAARLASSEGGSKFERPGDAEAVGRVVP